MGIEDRLSDKAKIHLTEIGGQLADSMITQVVEASDTPEDLENQVFVIQVAAIKILAAVAFNEYIQEGANALRFAERMANAIKADFHEQTEAYGRGEIAYARIGGEKFDAPDV